MHFRRYVFRVSLTAQICLGLLFRVRKLYLEVVDTRSKMLPGFLRNNPTTEKVSRKLVIFWWEYFLEQRYEWEKMFYLFIQQLIFCWRYILWNIKNIIIRSKNWIIDALTSWYPHSILSFYVPNSISIGMPLYAMAILIHSNNISIRL